jgi:hypothetical protein
MRQATVGWLLEAAEGGLDFPPARVPNSQSRQQGWYAAALRNRNAKPV